MRTAKRFTSQFKFKFKILSVLSAHSLPLPLASGAHLKSFDRLPASVCSSVSEGGHGLTQRHAVNKLINGFFSEVPRRLSTSLRYMYHIPKLSPRVLKFVNFAPELPRILAFVSRVHN